jgi:hypothetical protein
MNEAGEVRRDQRAKVVWRIRKRLHHEDAGVRDKASIEPNC